MKTNYEPIIAELSDKQAGVLFKAVLKYAATKGTMEGFNDGEVGMAFKFIKSDLDMFDKKYQETSLKRAESGRKGGLVTKQNKQMPAKQANAAFAKQNKQLLNNDNDKDNDSPPLPPVGGAGECFSDSENRNPYSPSAERSPKEHSAPNHNPYPSVIPAVRELLQPEVSEKFQRFVESKYYQNRIIDPIKQEDLLCKLVLYKPTDQIKILEYNTGTKWATFCIPDDVIDSRLAEQRKQDPKLHERLAKQILGEEEPCEA